MPVPQPRETVARHLLRDEAYDALRDAIVQGTLAPGEELHDRELCAWLRLSRTPVREALNRLREERLVDSAPQRFTRVAPLTLSDVQEVVPLVATLHGLATELAVARLRQEDVAELRAHNEAFVTALRRRQTRAAHDADMRFHEVFVEVSGNPEIRRVLAGLFPRLRRVENLREGPLPGGRLAAQHDALITRAVAGDAAGAASAARANWMTLGMVLAQTFA